ncbi:LysM peptidoglycan-binding domain-containing protein [Neobacillus mesonae]|uniref:cell division suppressor protein YneA n=1 Tax=Neobacillus mesonae TaxID=1193713 RepID=UPI002573B776|nr:LysM peptidoglycan-binding domain-containing protein [Neobacillus mesonae]MED4205276.1 LysM peptidoglycan-binding domain-containing protein [Neobacillus mesonae]
MKKLWNRYSYAIILLLLSVSFAAILSFQNGTKEPDQYLKVTVTEGDSLWKLSEQYAAQHSLSHAEFVNWVKKHNKNSEDKIYPGEEIVIPVSKNDTFPTELASAPGK